MYNLSQLWGQRIPQEEMELPSMLGQQSLGQVPQMAQQPVPQLPTSLPSLSAEASQTALSSIPTGFPAQQPISSGGFPASLGQAPAIAQQPLGGFPGLPTQASPTAQPPLGSPQSNPVAAQQPLPGGMPQAMPTQAQGQPNQARWDAFYAQQGRTRPNIQRPQWGLGRGMGLPTQASGGMFGRSGGTRSRLAGSRLGNALGYRPVSR